MTPGKLEKRIRFEFSDEPTFLEGSCASQKPTPKKSKRQVARRLNITKSEIDLVDVPGSYLGFYLSSRVILKFKLCTLSSIKSKKRPKDGVATFYLKLRESKKGLRASWIWSSILDGRKILENRSFSSIRNGRMTKVWIDAWVRSLPRTRISSPCPFEDWKDMAVEELIVNNQWSLRLY
ncbi:uncharacterized protein LOC129287072 isoform X2 [Prosopis cineraria]|uniref:uncharacterized protein LOC129287072 isoform X2 n=1 Tax=Prosopis cineraria TaxID=364024 RepID=UPI002410348E|nr:uncharacterized protein LOC129287072 isoform X2 [Prosopis cineraria]